MDKEIVNVKIPPSENNKELWHNNSMDYKTEFDGTGPIVPTKKYSKEELVKAIEQINRFAESYNEMKINK